MELLDIKKSPISGNGIYTKELILRGSRFYEIPLNTISRSPRSRFAFIGQGRYVNDEAVLNWVNHSCEPNTALNIIDAKPFLVALRDIEPGEEITCDYCLTEEGGVKVACACKSKKCRGFFFRIE